MPKPLFLASRRWVAFAYLIAVAGLALTFYQYAFVKRSYFDDTFIYLHLAQNAVEFGTWQYFPIADRASLVASSPLRAIVLTIATAVAWPFTGGARSLAAANLILPISAIITALLFLPFWRRDWQRFLYLAAPYALLAATLDSVCEFEAGLIYWWIATVVRDFAQRRTDFPAQLAVVLGPFVRPDVAMIGLVALLLAHNAKGDQLLPIVKRWTLVGLGVFAGWGMLCWAFGVWAIPTTYWTKAALPKLFDSSFMISFFFERTGQVALGAAPWSSTSFANALGVLWTSCLVIIAARSRSFRDWRTIAIVSLTILLLSRTPANYWWYYQNALVAAIVIALVLVLMNARTEARSACLLLTVTAFSVLLVSHIGREPNILWHFDRASRVQPYLAMSKTFARDGTIELPGLGRGYLKNPEIGITAYFGGRKAWIWDTGGLAQAHPQALKSPLRFFYKKPLRETPDIDARKLAKGGPGVRVFTVYALDAPVTSPQARCKHLLMEGALCVTEVTDVR